MSIIYRMKSSSPAKPGILKFADGRNQDGSNLDISSTTYRRPCIQKDYGSIYSNIGIQQYRRQIIERQMSAPSTNGFTKDGGYNNYSCVLARPNMNARKRCILRQKSAPSAYAPNSHLPHQVLVTSESCYIGQTSVRPEFSLTSETTVWKGPATRPRQTLDLSTRNTEQGPAATPQKHELSTIIILCVLIIIILCLVMLIIMV